MTISARSIAFFTDFRSPRVLRWIFVAAVLAAIVAMPGDAEARRARIYRVAGAYDGIWNVVFATQAGNCSATNNAPFAVSGRRVSSAGGGRLRVASAAREQCLSEYRSACRWPTVAAGSSATRGQADGAGSFPAIGAAAAGRPRGGSFYAGRPGERRDDEVDLIQINKREIALTNQRGARTITT
jgi:hypothetical protein